MSCWYLANRLVHPYISRLDTSQLVGETTQLTKYHGNPKPSFLGVITHILGVKPFIFHGFGVPW